MEARTALKKHIESTGLTPNRWSIEHGLDPSEISKILRGEKRSMRVALAVRIEVATGGLVKCEMWP